MSDITPEQRRIMNVNGVPLLVMKQSDTTFEEDPEPIMRTVMCMADAADFIKPDTKALMLISHAFQISEWPAVIVLAICDINAEDYELGIYIRASPL